MRGAMDHAGGVIGGAMKDGGSRLVMEHAAKDYIAGLAAGVATVLVGHPFDTVKVRLQTQNTAGHVYRYGSALHCTSDILKSEGVKGLYKGATSSFIGVSIESSLLFGAYSQIKVALQGGEDRAKPAFSTVLPSAALAGAVISAILCPMELVKCRLQVQAKDNGGCALGLQRYKGPLECVRKTIRTEGVKGLYCGWVATLLRETFGNVLFFCTYETTRYHSLTAVGLDPNRLSKAEKGKVERLSTQTSVTNTVLETGIGIATGGLAGLAFWIGVLPLDVAKTRIQTATKLNAERNPLYHLQLIYKQSGVRGLYAGLGPTLMRAFPANAVAIVTWEMTAGLLGGNGFSSVG